MSDSECNLCLLWVQLFPNGTRNSWLWLNTNHILPASIGRKRLSHGQALELECSVREYWPVLWWSRKLWDGRWKHGVVNDIQESKKVAQGRPGYCRIAAMNSASMTPRLDLVLPCDIISSLPPRFHSVLIAFLLLRNRETVLVVNNASARTASIFNCCQRKRGVAKMRKLVTRVELDLIG